MALRRERVASLLARRLNVREIAATIRKAGFDISDSTVYGDIAAIRQQTARELSESSVLDVAGDVQRAATVRERELWALFGQAAGKPPRKAYAGTAREEILDPGEPADRVLQLKVLAEMRANSNDTLKALQSLGVVYRVPVKVAGDLRLLALLGELPADQLAAIASASDLGALEQVLTSAVGADAAAAVIAGPERTPERTSGRALAPGEVAVVPAPEPPHQPSTRSEDDAT